jgi:hypothetical protein
MAFPGPIERCAELAPPRTRCGPRSPRPKAGLQAAQQFLAALARDRDDRLEVLRDHLDRSAPVLTAKNSKSERKDPLP